jgi:hypothetical protein
VHLPIRHPNHEWLERLPANEFPQGFNVHGVLR